jgi:integrase/recombinase XerD
VSPRRGQRTPHRIAGDPADLAGFPRLVTEFTEWMGTRGYSPRTIDNRRAMLSFLIDWLAERGVTRPVEVTRPMLESYQRFCFHYRKRDGHPLSFRSQSQRLLAVRAFFKWAARAHHVLHNPASEIELPKVEQRLPRPALTAAEAELVLARPDLSTPAGLRDRVMLEVLYATGIRRAELAHLAVFDVDVDRQTLLVRQGKGRRDRMVPLGERALAWLARYLSAARPQLVLEPDDGSLFLSADGIGFSPDRLTQIVGGYVLASGVGKQGACHLFRHTMATLMLEGGADIRYIQAMLGHAELSTTQIYTQVSIRALQAVHAATHPAASNTRHRSPTSSTPTASSSTTPRTAAAAAATSTATSSTEPAALSPSTEPTVPDGDVAEQPDGDDMTQLLSVLAEEIDQENRATEEPDEPTLPPRRQSS